jgi:hypothetical protein
MTITERTLRDWRKQALVENSELAGWDSAAECTSHRREMCERILRLTQELLDHHLIRKKVQKP